MDRISELPEEILHEILCRLPTKDAARMAVLSKPWLKACFTNPHLNFHEAVFTRKRFHKNYGESLDSSKTEHGEFLRFIDNSLERYCRQNQPISSFNLTSYYFNESDSDAIKKWVDIIAEKKVSQISVHSKLLDSPIFSNNGVFAIECLQQLDLSNCIIDGSADFEGKIKCCNLKRLTLHDLYVSELVLDCLISCCPQITMILLDNCCGFKCFRISKVPNLLSLQIYRCPEKFFNIVDAPKLLSFKYTTDNYYFPSKILMGSCQNLKRVEFVDSAIGDIKLIELLQKLPFIKELILDRCQNLLYIKISSPTLEFCSIDSCKNIKLPFLNVPKLLSLVLYGFRLIPLFTFERVSSQCRIFLSFVNQVWCDERFIGLRRFLTELNPSVDLTIAKPLTSGENYAKFLTESRVVGSIHRHPTPEVENLILKSYSVFFDGHHVKSYSVFFDAIFWTCWPKRLTIHCDNELRELLCEELLLERPSRSKEKCTWRDYLLNSQIEYMKNIADGWASETLSWEMLRANSRIIGEIDRIRFTPAQGKD